MSYENHVYFKGLDELRAYQRGEFEGRPSLNGLTHKPKSKPKTQEEVDKLMFGRSRKWLTLTQIREIGSDEDTVPVVAERYGVSPRTVQNCRRKVKEESESVLPNKRSRPNLTKDEIRQIGSESGTLRAVGQKFDVNVQTVTTCRKKVKEGIV